MGCLKIVDPDLAARDVRGDRQDRHAAALAIEQPIDQMQIAGTAAAGAHGKVAGEMSFGPRRESGSLLMAHVDPIDRFSSPQRIGNAVEGVADHTVDAFDASLLEGFNQVFGCSLAHNSSPWWVQDSRRRGSPREGDYGDPLDDATGASLRRDG